MKSTTLASLILVPLIAACQGSPSKLGDPAAAPAPKGGGEKTGGVGGATPAVAGGGGEMGVAAMNEVNALKKRISDLEGQLANRIAGVEDSLKDYSKYKTPLDVVAAKIKADAGEFKAPTELVIDTRIKALEEAAAKNEEMLEWLAEVYQQQQAQAPLDPAGLWAVDVEAAVKAGQYEGPASGAFVTIVEAWDYA